MEPQREQTSWSQALTIEPPPRWLLFLFYFNRLESDLSLPMHVKLEKIKKEPYTIINHKLLICIYLILTIYNVNDTYTAPY
jgi:hypothetical protein